MSQICIKEQYIYKNYQFINYLVSIRHGYLIANQIKIYRSTLQKSSTQSEQLSINVKKQLMISILKKSHLKLVLKALERTRLELSVLLCPATAWPPWKRMTARLLLALASCFSSHAQGSMTAGKTKSRGGRACTMRSRLAKTSVRPCSWSWREILPVSFWLESA